MNYSVQGVRAYFKSKGIDVKQGTIEAFRSKLQEAGIIGNNQPMTNEHLIVFHKVVAEKDDNNTWESLMSKHIFTDLRQYIKQEFKWTPEMIIKSIINGINDGHYKAESMDINYGTEDWFCMCSCVDNFAELGKFEYAFKGSKGTDIGIYQYKVTTLNDCCYYIISKLNPHTGNDDIHVFYNPHPHFELMQCKHVATGTFGDKTYMELLDVCRMKILGKE